MPEPEARSEEAQAGDDLATAKEPVSTPPVDEAVETVAADVVVPH